MGRQKAAASPVCGGMEDICPGRVALSMIIGEGCRKVEMQYVVQTTAKVQGVFNQNNISRK